MGKRLASAIPHCRATFFPGEGHWAIYSHWQEMLTALVQSEAATREGPQLATISLTVQANNSGPETVALPECPDMAIVDTPADSSQGLQPAREAAEVVPTESAEGETTILADTPADVSPDTEPVQKAPKPVSREDGQASHRGHCRHVGQRFSRTRASRRGTKPVSKKTAGRRTAAADTPAKVSPESEPVQKPSRPVSKKTAGRRTTAVADAPTRGFRQGQASTRENQERRENGQALRSGHR